MTDSVAAGTSISGSLHSADGAGIVQIKGRFDAGADDVWSALTDGARLAEWLGELEGDLRPGGEFRARFFATGWEGTCRVEVCAPSRRLRISTRSEGEPDCTIEVTVVPNGEQTTVVVEDQGLPLTQIAAYGAGDQVLVEDLAAYLGGHGRCDAQARWRALHPGYEDLAAALNGAEASSL